MSTTRPVCDLAIHGVVQARPVGRRVGHGVGLGARDLAFQPARRDLGVEGALLRHAPFVVIGNLLPVGIERAGRRGAGCRIAGIGAALIGEERNDVDHWLLRPKWRWTKGGAARAITAQPIARTLWRSRALLDWGF
ncbi:MULTISPECIES: hypothetical protein [unclassified Mesorhizobium]|uniref:hypothetical protein n=1 Tax=unclassified Mesorhizobium TaxID=325217 RepID=UPI000FCB3E19|nr:MULTISPECIES: hypothetical protein [unclassified Mesorhizobium]TGP17892.1 hypothetical protein EN874_031815 [Mesorhizobium sp. M1D.F.Ca.ET.231.01.1.1]TGP24535.1 hypothetical protein EN877_31355 [Mesorhizobium sp. M1D.F.Ca.ET.234.01.1.1]TGS36682.1 hypothetical protein EN827_31815 [Mesorhizobium sp. M1D.F.Ca.ET.184.01.1.1]TGS57897.1 hypothetical protein EN826_031785 [Mesorhizobium sp. M1D.F.Ca.ET.183.01.1.1]